MTLVGLTAIWGATFTIVHGAVRSYPPISFLALRSGIAALVLLPLLPALLSGSSTASSRRSTTRSWGF